MVLNREALFEKMEELRRQLESRFEECGKVSTEVLRLSQELDELIVEYKKALRGCGNNHRVKGPVSAP